MADSLRSTLMPIDPVDWARALEPEDWSLEELFRLADAFIREGGARTMMGDKNLSTEEIPP